MLAPFLTKRQTKAVCRLTRYDGGAVWWRVGTGKTRIALTFFAMIAIKSKQHSNFLVVCRREAFADWEEEIHKLKLKWKVQHLEQVADFAGMLSRKETTVYIMSHGKLARLKEDLIESAGTVLDAVCYDEGFLYKNSQTQHCKVAHRLSKAVGQAILLSGSMMTARNLEDIFGQLYAINHHARLARTLTDFRSRFMFHLRIGDPTKSGPATYTNRAGAAKRVGNAIRGRCSVYFPGDNRRKIIEATHEIPATRNQIDAFQEIREYYWLNLGGKELILKNVPSLIIKCQQISDGWVKMSDSKQSVISISSAKLDYLVGRVGELLSCGESVVIWCAFQHTVDLVLQRLQSDFPHFGVYGFHGSMPMNRSGWEKNGRVCVATEGSGSSINFLRHCAFSIYYSMGFSWLHLQQSQGRTNRFDSKHDTCFYDFLHTKGSFDKHVLRLVKSSSRAEQKLILLSSIKSWLDMK